MSGETSILDGVRAGDWLAVRIGYNGTPSRVQVVSVSKTGRVTTGRGVFNPNGFQRGNASGRWRLYAERWTKSHVAAERLSTMRHRARVDAEHMARQRDLSEDQARRITALAVDLFGKPTWRDGRWH